MAENKNDVYEQLLKAARASVSNEKAVNEQTQPVQPTQTQKAAASTGTSTQKRSSVYEQLMAAAEASKKGSSSAVRLTSGERYAVETPQPKGSNAAKGTSRTHSWVYDKADSRVSPVGELGNSPYKEYLQREDYKQKSQAAGSKKRLIGGDELYDYINNIGDERQLVEQLTQQGRGDKGYAKYAFMTEDEVGIYNYLYATEGKKAAKRFLNSIDPGLNEQWFSGASSSMADAATKSGANRAAFSALTVAAQPVRTATSAMAGVQDWFRVMNDREIDPYSPLRRTSQMTQSIRNAIAEQPGFVSSLSTAELMRAADEYALAHGTDANNPYIKAFTESSKEKNAADAFLYQTVMSAADSAVNMMIAQGLAHGYTGMKGIDLGTKAGTDALMKATNVIGSALMSSEVASLGVAEAKQKVNPATGKRYSDAGALAIGMARGGIEYLSEKIGGDWAISMIKANPRNFLLNMAKIMIPEGVEEVMADTANGILNLGIDEIFGTQESSIPQLIEYYKNNGTPWQKENPEVAMVLSIIGDEMLAFMGGALATVGTAGVQTVNFNRGVNAVSQRLNTDQEGVLQLMDDYKTENPGEIYELSQRFNTEDVEDFRAKVGEGRTAAEVLEEQRQKDKAEAGTIAGKIRQGFRGVGHNLTDAEVKILSDGFETGDADEDTYLSAIHSAYNLGKSGNFTLQEAIRASSYAGKINEAQFRHAFELGASQALSDIDTVDVNTGEGQEKLAASLSSLGNYAGEAAAAYEAGQDVNTYAEAMYKAASLYVANGKDLDAVVADARSGKTSNIVGRLTDAQIQVAKAIGEKMRAANQEQVQKASQQRAAAREANTAGEKRVGNISIATESGSIEGMKYNAVDESKLNKSQKNVMRFADTVANVLGLDITVVSGVGTFGGAYSGNGKIYLNINSGMNLRTYSKVIAAASLGHEIVHALKDRAEAEYEVLKQRVIDSMSEDKLEELVQEQLRTQPNLTYDGAVDEVVANACQTMLQNSEALKQLARESMTTAEKIQDVIHEFVEKIHAAFAEVDYHDNLPIFHAVQAVEKSLDQIQKDFDNALIAAKRNADAEVGGNKKAASEGGVQLQAFKGYDEITGRGIYESNFPEGTPAAEKSKRVVELVQKVWSKQPIDLLVTNDDGSTEIIQAKFDPDFDETGARKTDLGKLAYGNRQGTRVERRVTLNLADDYYQILQEARHVANDTDYKQGTVLHQDVEKWRYFVNDILYQEQGKEEKTPYSMYIDVKQTPAGGFVYTFHAEEAGKNNGQTTPLHIAAAVDSSDKGAADGLPTDRITETGEEVKNGEKKTYYQLIDVDPVQPSSDAWSRTATTEEAMQAYPNLWNVAAEESETNNPTQRASTVSTYRNIYNILKKEGFSGKVLDASSGMGFGTQLGRSKEFGFDVDDIEPYPGQNYKPKYTDYSKLNKKYDAIISSAVLNVLPQDQRDALVVKMGELLNPGGKMYITTRGTKGDVDNLAKTGKNYQLGPSEFIETVKGSYQKGFTQNELKAYLEDALGDQFTVELSNKSNGGKFNNNTSIVVTKNGAKAQSQPTAKVDSRVKRGTERQLQEIGSTATDGVVVSDDMAALMREDGFSKPVDPVDQLSTQYQVWTTDEWEKNYLTSGGDLTVAAQIRDFTNAMIADDAIMGYVPDGHYQKSRFGPLRKNIEYRWTFDMDASCPRTFQFVNYRNALQTIAGRPLTDSEAMNLLYLMRRMNQQIPCTYRYVENKRIMKSKSYLDWFQSRADVMSAATDEEALKKMYSYDPKKGTVGAAAQKVFDEWRADVKAGKAYYPTAQEVWTGWNTAKNTVFNFLDKGLENGVIRFGEGVKNATTQKKMVDAVCKRFNITDKAARREIEGFVAKWRYDVLAGTKHVYDVVNDTSVDTINQDILRLNRLASNYASSVSQARLVDDYIPYTDQLKNVSKADKDYIMGMGGIRKHSSNDFRIDYVQDYFLFYADLAAGGWTGHTYTKSVDYCKVFGRTGDRINLSIAMNTENGKIVENQQEGAAWKDARELREVYKDVGVMAMVTDNAQLSFALNSDWIDMCIPFHASGLPKAVWYNLRAWSDYTSVQLESYFNSTEMKERLTAAKVNVKGLNSEEIEALYNETFNVPVIRNQNGQRVKPHFFPNDTTIYGPGGVAQVIPGHHNDAKRYFELCEQYGVHPRFYGTKVTDANGKVIDVTEHPNYLKLIKETSRTDTEQEPIKFNFNEKDEYLGVSPFEYAMQRMQEEAKIGGYKNTAADPLGIVDMFKELYLGKNRDIGWMPADTDESAAAERLRTAMEITASAYNEMYDADVQTLDVEGYQKALVDEKKPAQLQTWSEGEVYNDRALVSEETLDKWMSSGWYGSSNPNYAQAYITSMSPSQFLRLTTIYDESRIRRESESFTMEGVRQASESQPIQLQIDTETGKVVGHEGRHRMAALERNGIYEVPVLLFDSGNKYSKQTMKEFRLYGQDFNGNSNIARATVYDVYPLNQAHRSEIVNAYSKQTSSERVKEKYSGAQTVRFQQWDETGDDTASEKQGRQSAYARLQSENAILKQTVKELKRTVGKQKTTLANIQKQLQLTKTPETRLSDARKLAKAIIAESGSKAADGNVAAAIKQLGDYILNTQADQLNEEDLKNRARAIAREVLDSATETMTLEGETMQVNPYDAYMGEATEDLANRIVMDAMNGVLRPTAPTKADKQQARTQALKDRIQDLIKENKLQQREGASLYQTIYDLSLQLDKAQSRYETLRQNANRRVAEVRAEGAARAAEVKATERARAEGLLEEQKQHYLDIAKRARERRETAMSARAFRSRIMKLYKEFVRQIQHPTEAKHIPPQLMQQAADILSVLNMDNSREGSKAGQKLKEKLATLKATYDGIQKDPDFRAAAAYDPIVSEMMQTMIDQVGDTPINQMSVQQLEIVYNVLKAMQVTAKNAMKIQLGNEERDAYQASVQMTNETRSSPNKAGTGLFARWLNSQLSPERMFHRLGGYHKNSMWSKVYQMLNGGQLKSTQIFVEGSRIFDKLMGGRDYDGFVNPKNTVDIGLKDENGNTAYLTHGMMVSLYMHLQNEDNTRHAILGGVEVPALKDYYNGKKTRGTERAVRVGGLSLEAVRQIDELREQLKNTEDPNEQRQIQDEINDATEEALAYADELRSQIEQKLTDYDRQWITALRILFDQFSKDQINATTMDVYGIKKAGVDNYYPIWVDGDFLNTPFESIARDFSIENVGFLKERVTSNKPIRLADASEVAASQLKKVAQYCGLMPVIRDFNKIWGKTQRSYSDSLKKAVHSVFGETGVQYIDNLMADLNGARGGDDGFGGEIFNRLRGHMAQAALTLSMRTAFGQTASYPTAASVVGWGPLLKALARGGKNNTVISRADKALIEKYSPLLAYRMKGYSSIELGDIASSNSKMARLWKKMRWATGWIQFMDGATVGRLWYAAEYYVQDHNKDLEKGTDAYYQEVAKVFNDIVEKTQPDYTTMQRPDILRNPNALVRSLTMFLTQRLQNMNIVFDAAATLTQAKKDYAAGKYEVSKEDVHQAAADSRRAVVSQLVAGATIVIFKFLADAILHNMNAYRDDDTGELTEESVGLQLLDMFLDSLTGNFLWGGELYDLVESYVFGKSYYGVEVSSISTVKDTIESFNNLLKEYLENGFTGDKVDGVPDDNLQKKFNAFAKDVSTILGIPLGNAEKIVNGVIYHAQDFVNDEFGSFNAGYDPKTKQKANALINAYEAGNKAEIDRLISQFENEEKAMNAVKAQLKDSLKSGDRTEAQINAILKKAGMSDNDTYFLVQKWKTGEDSKYTELKRAAIAGDKTAYQAAMKALTSHGIKEKDAHSQIKNFIRDAYLGKDLSEEEAKILGGKTITDADARKLLHAWAGMDTDDAVATVRDWTFEKKNGYSYSNRKQAYMEGDINRTELKKILMSQGGKSAEDADEIIKDYDFEKQHGWAWSDRKVQYNKGKVSRQEMLRLLQSYGGKTEEQAESQLAAWDWAKDIPGAENITVSAIEKYDKYCANAGVDKNTFVKAWNSYNNTDADINAKGETVPYSKTIKVMPMIDALPISKEQKTAIALCFWSKKTVRRYKTW